MKIYNLIQECYDLLSSSGEKFWSKKMHFLIEHPEKISSNMILSWYGGMGSFNDLIISTYNGHIVNKEEDESMLNDKLSMIRTAIYNEARKMNKVL